MFKELPYFLYYLYPVVYLVNKGAMVSELCPMGQTISEQELRTKAKILDKLSKKMDSERRCKIEPYFHLSSPP